jgi:hypothetical protein
MRGTRETGSEPERSENSDSTTLPALEVAWCKACAGGEFVRCSQDRLGWVQPTFPDEVVTQGTAEAMRRKECLWAQSVVFAERSYDVRMGHRVPGHRHLTSSFFVGCSAGHARILLGFQGQEQRAMSQLTL